MKKQLFVLDNKDKSMIKAVATYAFLSYPIKPKIKCIYVCAGRQR